MGETSPPTAADWAQHTASNAQQDARLAQNQMERLLHLLVGEKILLPEHAAWVKNAPR